MKYNCLISILLIFISLISFTSCNNFEGDQEIPSYIRVHGVKMVPNENLSFPVAQDEAFLTSEISDLWLTVTIGSKQKDLGAYSLTKDSTILIPVLAKGRCFVQLKPGIKYNGMSATREYYRFYTVFADTLDLVPGKITDVEMPTFSYNNYATLSYSYFFEDSFNPFENADTLVTQTYNHMHLISNDSVAYGNKCAAMYSNSSLDDYKVITRDSIKCSNRYAMILELDYHSNIPFEMGLYGQSSSQSKYYYISTMRLKPNDNKAFAGGDKRNWQKMYIILGKVWSQLNYMPFKIWFSPRNTDNNPNGFVHIDNIKILHFPE